MSEAVLLEVPYDERDEAKSLGAHQDPETGEWYVPAGLSLEPFARWLPEPGGSWEVRFTISAPIYVAESVHSCATCGCKTPVVALAVEEIAGIFEDEEEDEKGLILLNDIEEIPDELAGLLGARYPFLKMQTPEIGGRPCLVNSCSCGAQLVDFYLQAEPDGGFFPDSDEDAAEIVLRELPVSGPFEVKAAFGKIVPDIIGPNARREPFWEGEGAAESSKN